MRNIVPVSVVAGSHASANGINTSNGARRQLDAAGQNLLQTLKANDIRAGKVAEVRSAIGAGTYETDEKLDAAVDKLFNDLT